MTTDDLFVPTTASNPAATRPRCRRHAWHPRSPEDYADGVYTCLRCGTIRDEATRRRNRNNRARGAGFERTVAKRLGGRRTGPLGGRDDVVSELFAVQTKKTVNFSARQARIYLDDLRRVHPTRIPLVVHADPGRDRDAVVILTLDDFVDLHGPTP